MELRVAEQTLTFFQACLLGAVLGAFYDVFRISRVAVPTGKRVIFVEDLLFFVVCGTFSFLFMLRFLDGKVRFFILLGELLGAILYYFTLGQLVMRVSTAIINVIKTVLRLINRLVIQPIWWLFYQIVRLILYPLRFLSAFFKKILQTARFRLKTRRILLYNQIQGYLGTKRLFKGQKRQAREQKKHGKKKSKTK